jgi:hypothetical protein
MLEMVNGRIGGRPPNSRSNCEFTTRSRPLATATVVGVRNEESVVLDRTVPVLRSPESDTLAIWWRNGSPR